MWDAGANGYARGDGVAAIVLKTLSAALADGDNIECVIREIGVNQDGRSHGITMPSATAQAALIRSTYARAGLDPQNKQDRCHYFEAHGTGTQAGDPVEAEAIQLAFFGKDESSSPHEGEPLYVGSIKTVIGHTEATAGIAGLLKAAQALKHSCVPPNLLLDRLNPSVEPFYKNVLIPQEPTPWPKISGQPRRASVNSFGFGGTNAHVILESFDTHSSEDGTTGTGDLGFIPPFIFSAQSEQSLAASLAAYLEYLKLNPDTNPSHLSYTLRERRSQLSFRVSLPGSSISTLQAGLKELLGKDLNINRAVNSGEEVRLLGVFTGQGAQWARMGAELVESLPEATSFLSELDESLAQLPQQYRPSWTLKSELLADASSSKVGEAFISQPLCTAIQIVLVKLLRLIGINFAAVVGHSSGEIAAAFAAGYLTEEQAIRIAYYRGLHSHLAGGPDGVKGAMLAVGTSQEDAEELCKDPEFEGRVSLAACNSPSSVTLSGDEDAIADIAAIFEDENKFVRRLKVDKAYHSHHMQPCADAYLLSMETDAAQVQKTEPHGLWVSSVYPDRVMEQSPDASYWIDNLTSPVLFMQAVERVLSANVFDAAIEVGPHPALKGPVREILAERKIDLPYTGLLQRNVNANRAFSGAFGYLWENLENVNLNFDSYGGGSDKPSIRRYLPNLPVYQWNHSQEYWHESILSHNLRQRKHAMHPLLGNLSPTSSAHQFVWKHILRPQDIPWVHGHRIQGQTIFPAAGYAVTALESAFYVAADEPIKLISIENLVIHQATVLDEDGQGSGIETQFAVNNIIREKASQITACFTYETNNGSQEGYQLVASGMLVIDIGQPTHDVLPVSSCHELDTTEVPINSFYSALEEIGYGYTGPFRAFSQLRRRFGAASGVIMPSERDYEYALHPALLDVGFQATFAALGYPRDGRLRALHLPTTIKRIRINPALCGSHLSATNGVPITSVLTDAASAHGYQGDIEFHDVTGTNSAIQVQGFGIVPMSEATPADDKQLFYNTDWVEAEPNADIPGTYEATTKERELALILERVSCFYLRQLKDQFPADHPGREDKFNAAYLEFAEYTYNLCVTGKHKYARKEWLSDTLEDIYAATAPFSELSEVRVAHLVGEQMPRAILGETTMVEQLLMTGVLDEYYAHALGFVQVASALADTVLQIARRYPDARILEVGAGTGSATRQVLQRLKGYDFGTYTYTDISAGFFGNAAAEFADYKSQMTFKVLNLEQDIASQGFEKNSYDVVVASLVVHATENLDQTMRRVRSLLKPGGYLVMSEGTNLDATRVTHVFGCLSGWWLGRDEGRVWGPSVSVDQWDEVLRKTGFSGVDSMTPTTDDLSYLNSVVISQAVDDWVSNLREPLLTSASLFAKSSPIQELVIVGGSTFQVARLVDGIYKLVGSLCDDISRYKTLDELMTADIGASATILVLADLDQPVFKDVSEARLEGLKKLFNSEKSIMWVTKDRLSQNPFSNMIVGFARSVLWEVPDLQYQFVDFEATQRIDPRVVSECLLRFKASVSIPESKRETYLWSTEWEVIIDVDGRQRIPRLRAAQEMNDRYNSGQRAITKEIKIDSSTVTISDNDNRYIVEEQPAGTVPDQAIDLKLTHSTVRKFPTALGDYYLVLGNCCETKRQYIALVDALTSSSKVPQNRAVPISASSQLGSVFLSFVASRLAIPSVIKGFQRGDSALIHNAPIILVSILAQEASIRDISLFFSTTSQDTAKLRGWNLLTEYMLPSHLRAVLPYDLAHSIDFTEPNDVSILSNEWISSRLASQVKKINTATLFQTTHERVDLEQINEIVVKALADLENWDDIPAKIEIDAQEFVNTGGSCGLFSILTWESSSLSVPLKPVTSSFNPDRTYWLVGLSGDLGLSIADWMIGRGAKNLVITSRNPKVSQSWQKSAVEKGAAVRLLSRQVIALRLLYVC
jgi:hybrid polyketide synthase/nonribosomal peptide synthetase ACE1